MNCRDLGIIRVGTDQSDRCVRMKIKLNHKQIESIRLEIKKTERRGFKLDDVSQVFRMLQYWSKSIGGKDVKIQSVTELADGYMCRVNSKFRETMKTYLKHIRQQRIEMYEQASKEKQIHETVDKYDELIREAEESRQQADDSAG